MLFQIGAASLLGLIFASILASVPSIERPDTKPEKTPQEKQEKPEPIESNPGNDPTPEFELDLPWSAKVQVIHHCLPTFDKVEESVRHCHGIVHLRFDVTESGKAKNIRVVESAPDGIFTEAAIDALKCSTFQEKAQQEESDNFRRNLRETYRFNSENGNCR